MARRRLIHRAVGVALALLAALVLSAGAAGAHGQDVEHDESGLTPSYGDGRLSVTGHGFMPGEPVTLTATVEGAAPVEQRAVADAQGELRIDTGLTARPGQGVALHARGDRGTVKAAITTVPSGWALPIRLPRTGEFGIGEWLVVATALYALPMLAMAGVRRYSAAGVKVRR
jgi:hypothetical protein